LGIFSAHLAELGGLLEGFDPFGHNRHIELVSQGDDGAHDFVALLGAAEAMDEGAIDFDGI